MTEWTEADKAAYMLFAQEVRDTRDYLRHADPSPHALTETNRRLQAALDRLGAR